MWHPPETGQLRQRLSLESATRTDDAIGGWTLDWTLESELWGEVKARTGRETVLADARSLRRTHEVTVRFSSAVQPDKRFIYRGEALRIISVEDPDGKAAFLVCQCNRDEI